MCVFVRLPALHFFFDFDEQRDLYDFPRFYVSLILKKNEFVRLPALIYLFYVDEKRIFYTQTHFVIFKTHVF